MSFVGFRGSQQLITNGHAKGYLNSINIKGQEFRGEVHPEPIVPVTNVNRENLIKLTGKTSKQLGRQFYLGILLYELEILTLLFTLRNMGYENHMVWIPRGHGKTYCEDWEGAIGLKYWNDKILLLSETDAVLKVGNWMYIWAFKNGYLKDPEKYERKSTYQHFTLLNGGTLDIYKYMDKRTVGLHEIRIVADDMVNLDWRNRPTDNKRAIDHWQSSLNPMIRTGFTGWGTRKYEGDPLQHLVETIEDIILIKMSPFKQCPHENLNDDGTYDMCDECQDEILIAPEIHSYKSLRAKMFEDWEVWFAEYMQNPHPTEGGMVNESDIQYIDRPPWQEVKSICIGVDSTESDLDSTDMCGIVSCALLRNRDSDYKRANFPDMGGDIATFVFLDADVRKMPFRTLRIPDSKGYITESQGILETISLFVRQYEVNYPNVRIQIAIERQGGGVFIIKEARADPKKWWWQRYLIGERKKEKRGNISGEEDMKYGVSHSKEKVGRVFSELQYPIKNGQVKFSHNLWGSVFMLQVLTFPKGKYDDGVDAGGMAKDEGLKRWIPSKRIIKRNREQERKDEIYQKRWKQFSNPIKNAMEQAIGDKSRVVQRERRRQERILEKMGVEKK